MSTSGAASMFSKLAADFKAVSQSVSQSVAGQVTTVREKVNEKMREVGTTVHDSKSQSIELCGFQLEGISIAGQETCIIVPRCKVVFDIGRCPQRACFQQTVLVTHGHLDHIGGLHYHASTRALQDQTPSRFVMHPQYVPDVEKFLTVAGQLNGYPLPFDIVPLKVGEELVLSSGFIVRPFNTFHPVTSQGYILYSERKKLRADLQGKSQEEIRELRAAGQDVTDVVQIPEIAFTGDTTAELLDAEGMDDVFKARLLIIEMTFIDDSVTLEQAKERGHMHIANLVAHQHKFQNEAILFVHFSSRFKRQEILDSLNTHLPPALRSKCHAMLNGFV